MTPGAPCCWEAQHGGLSREPCLCGGFACESCPPSGGVRAFIHPFTAGPPAAVCQVLGAVRTGPWSFRSGREDNAESGEGRPSWQQMSGTVSIRGPAREGCPSTKNGCGLQPAQGQVLKPTCVSQSCGVCGGYRVKTSLGKPHRCGAHPSSLGPLVPHP